MHEKAIKNIDFNIDLAQSFGVYKNTNEFDLLDYASSVNVSCGFHAGDPLTIRNALLKAKEKNVVIGAHIGFDDIQGFGYREMELDGDEIEALVVYQVGALMTFAKAFNMEIEHVRPHGAMYKKCATDFSFACNVAKAVQKCSKWLVYYGAAGEITEKTGDLINIPIAREVCLEKMYNADGTVNTIAKDCENTEMEIQRLKQLLATSQVSNIEGGKTVVTADTIHFSNRLSNSLELIKQASEIIIPVPVNYKNACLSGWVE
ncbi:LamB/YcsF family protein [bacterium]|nr:LamB/YcsF family protein [bacterium]